MTLRPPILYVTMAGLTAVAGIVGAAMGSPARLGFAHSLSLGVVLLGMVVLTSELLLRIGYVLEV